MGFWDEHCPSRPAQDLKHRHARDCTDGHLNDQCCECGQLERNWTPPPLNVNERLEDLGLMPKQIPPPPEPEPLDDAEAIMFLAEGLGPRTARRRINDLRLLRWLYHERPERVR